MFLTLTQFRHPRQNKMMMMSQRNPKDEATRRVKAALMLLPGTLTAVYSVALLQSPELVETESDPSWFLMSEKDFQKAAFKLSMYWSKRYIYFGPRAYRPLNQSGNGALSPEDLAVLPTSCLQALPPDSQGRAVYWISSTRAINFQTEADIRCLFYQLQLAKGGLSAVQGIVVLLLVEENTNNDYTRLSTLLCLISELLATVMPFRIRHLHILSRNPSENASLTISGVVKLVMDKSLSQECSIGTATSHLPQEMLGKLVSFGMSPQGLPLELGGSYVPVAHAAAAGASLGEAIAPLELDQAKATWTAQLPAASLDCSSSSAHFPVPLWGYDTCNLAEAVARVLMPAPAPVKEEDDRKRKAVDPEDENKTTSSRNKRPAAIPQDAPELAASYSSLMNDLPTRYASLALPSEAGVSLNNDDIAQAGGTPEEQEAARKAIIRKRNALYSRRKYVRRRIEVEVMEDQRTSLMTVNAGLLHEQQRLERLLALANQCVEGALNSSAPFGVDGSASLGHAAEQQRSAASRQQQEPASHHEPAAEQELLQSTGQRRQEHSADNFLAVAAALATRLQQVEQGGLQANRQEEEVVGQGMLSRAVAMASGTDHGVDPAPVAPTSHDVASRPFSTTMHSLTLADRTAFSTTGNVPPTITEILASLGQNLPASNSDISNLISILTRGGPDTTRGLAMLGQSLWNPSSSASLTRNDNSRSSVAPAASASSLDVGSSQAVRPLLESTGLLPNTTMMLHSGRVLPSSLLTRPYMQGSSTRAPLLPNAHLSSSSDEDSEEQKKPAV